MNLHQFKPGMFVRLVGELASLIKLAKLHYVTTYSADNWCLMFLYLVKHRNKFSISEITCLQRSTYDLMFHDFGLQFFKAIATRHQVCLLFGKPWCTDVWVVAIDSIYVVDILGDTLTSIISCVLFGNYYYNGKFLVESIYS